MPTELSLRPADPGDLAAIAEVHLRARAGAVPAMPPAVHPAPEVRQWVAGWQLSENTVWVAVEADRDHRVVGYARFTRTWLDDLYVEPDRQGAGIGSALLDVVKAHRPGGFDLWVFQSNHPARRFYHRHGLTEVERTDGSGNEERAPDVRMAWLPRESPSS